MEEERHVWEQREGEPDLWYGRFTVFRRMGTRRSVNAVFKKELTARNHEKPREKEASGDWYDAAKTWAWEQRARAWDEHQRAEEDRVIAEEREKVLRSGFALMHKRIKELDRLTHKLARYANEETNVWIPETRTFVTGEDSSQVVEKVTFNAPLFTTIDKLLDSIAKETGERVKQKNVTIAELPANVYLGFNPDEDGVEQEGDVHGRDA